MMRRYRTPILESFSGVRLGTPVQYLVHLAIFLAMMLATKYFFEIGIERYRVFRFDGWVNFLLQAEADAVHAILRFLGMEVSREDVTYTFPNGHAMIIQEGCSGFKQLFQVFFVFLVIPGIWIRKTWYIPSVLLIMFCATLIHLVILSIVMANVPAYFQLTHVWVNRALFYGIMFLTWLYWEERVGLREIKK